MDSTQVVCEGLLVWMALKTISVFDGELRRQVAGWHLTRYRTIAIVGRTKDNAPTQAATCLSCCVLLVWFTYCVHELCVHIVMLSLVLPEA